jgi:hypothetical protein
MRGRFRLQSLPVEGERVVVMTLDNEPHLQDSGFDIGFGVGRHAWSPRLVVGVVSGDVHPLGSVIAQLRVLRQMRAVLEPPSRTSNLPVRPGRLIKSSLLRWEWGVGLLMV